MAIEGNDGGVWAGCLVIPNGHTGEYQWYFGPTQRVPFDEECIICGENWKPECVFHIRSFALSKSGRYALDRLCETDGEYTDVRHFADWITDVHAGDGVHHPKAIEAHTNKIRFSGFETMPMDIVSESVSGQRFEGSAYANLCLLIHAISFREVRTGELRSDSKLKEGIDDIIWKCHSVIQKDSDGIFYYRYAKNECWICGEDIPDGEGIMGIACEDGLCYDRIGDDNVHLKEELTE